MEIPEQVASAALPSPTIPVVPAAAPDTTPSSGIPSTEQLRTVDQLAQQVSAPTGNDDTEEEREQRGQAIRQAGSVTYPRAVRVLADALRNDADVRNRILAVESLHLASAKGDPAWVGRDALREASTSSDEIVAAHAREAYDDLIRRLGTQR